MLEKYGFGTHESIKSKVDYVKQQVEKVSDSSAAKKGASWMNKYGSLSVGNRLAIGAGIGAAKAMFDGESDNLLTTGFKAAGMAGGIHTLEQLGKSTLGHALKDPSLIPSGGRMALGYAGAAAGIAYTLFNGKNDDLLSTTGNVLAGAGMTMAADRLIFKGLGESAINAGLGSPSVVAPIAKEKVNQVINKIGASKMWEGAVNGKYHGKIAAVGAAVGLFKTVADRDKDNAVSTAFNMGVGAGMFYAGSKGAEWLMNNEGAQKLTAAAVGKITDKTASKEVASKLQQRSRTAMADISKIDVKKEAISSMAEGAWSKHGSSRIRKAGLLGAIGVVGAIGVASVLDTSSALKSKTRENRMVAQQEENLIKKQNMMKRNRESMGYGHVDFGQMAIDMFNDRIGHHKMGNSKFH